MDEGWMLTSDPSAKERRRCVWVHTLGQNHGIPIVRNGILGKVTRARKAVHFSCSFFAKQVVDLASLAII
jgi:hypothetical protein